MLEKITESVYAHTAGKTIGNVGVIAIEQGNYIIDTSMYPKIARDLRKEIEQINTGKIRGAILTHYHFDHSGGNQVFSDFGIHGHKYVDKNMLNNYSQEQMENNLREREDKELFEGLEITRPTKLFETNPYYPDSVNNIEVYQVGGHTDGSSLIKLNSENVVFVGDNLFAGSFMWGGDPTASPYDWYKSMELIQKWKPDIIVPGHGNVQYNLKEINKLRNYLGQIIEIGEKLSRESVPSSTVIEELMEIEYHPETREGRKEGTLNHWYNVIKGVNTSTN